MSPVWLQPLSYWRMGGPVLIPLALVCYGVWFHFLRTRGLLLDALRAPADFEEILVRDLSRPWGMDTVRKYAAMDGLPPRAVACALNGVLEGRRAGDAFSEFEGARLAVLGRDIVILGALTVTAPLLGLLGTVVGMIDTFRVVAGPVGGSGASVAAGISQALITTQFGLVIAIPGVFGLARLRRIIGEVRTRLLVCKAHLLMALDGGVARRAVDV